MTIVEELIQSREAFERRDWAAVQQGLSAVDRRWLSSDDLLRLGLSAYLLGDHANCVRTLQQAYEAALAIGETVPAVRIAFWLGFAYVNAGDAAVGGGWIARAQGLLADVGGDVVERGYLLIGELFRHLGSGDFAGALEVAPRITDYGRRFDDADLTVMGLASEGRLLLYTGRVPEALALLDQAMSRLTTSEVSPVIAGTAYCTMIEGCQEIADYSRVELWTRTLTAWCESQPDLVPFTGQCAVHRAQVMRAAGSFEAALIELDHAFHRYETAGQSAAAGLALTERGDILRLRRAYDDAEQAYAQAGGYGHDPQPGLALLWLATGRKAAAVHATHRLLQEATDPVARARVLPAAVEILLADGDRAGARAAADELSRIAHDFGCPAQRAAAGYAAGSVAVATGEATEALRALRRSLQWWSGLRMPYEAARTRIIIALAYRDLGDEDSARVELSQARETLRELGAKQGVLEVDRLLTPELPDGITPREAEVLKLVAAGKSNAAIAAELVLSEKTIARHLSNLFLKINVSSRTAAAAYAFEHDLA